MPERSTRSGTLGIGSVLGVPIRLHFTFVILLVFLAYIGLTDKQSLQIHLLYLALMFGSVLLHEIGHVAAGKIAGIRTREIVMFPVGGVSQLETNPTPRKELFISLAGPFANLLIAAALAIWMSTQTGGWRLAKFGGATDENLIQRLFFGNLILALFNLVPAFPMDGGRALRSLLSLYRPENEARQLSGAIGRTIAVVMCLYGLFWGEYMLAFIAVFIYVGAAQESAAAIGKSLLEGTPVRAAMVTQFQTLSHGDTLRDAADKLLSTTQQDFPVMLGDQVVGLLGRANLLRGMASEGPEAFIAGFMDRDFERVKTDTDLAEAVSLLADAGHCILVMDGERLLGLLTSENVSEFIVLKRIGMGRQEHGVDTKS
jgi:Zn-dependent protease